MVDEKTHSQELVEESQRKQKIINQSQQDFRKIWETKSHPDSTEMRDAYREYDKARKKK